MPKNVESGAGGSPWRRSMSGSDASGAGNTKKEKVGRKKSASKPQWPRAK